MSELSGDRYVEYPEHDPALGYYLYRGVPDGHRSDYLGPHWTENPCYALMFALHAKRAEGNFYVAYTSFEEVIENDESVRANMQMDAEHYVEYLKKEELNQFYFPKNPASARPLTRAEIEQLFFDRPEANIAKIVHSAYEDSINWRERSRTVFTGRF